MRFCLLAGNFGSPRTIENDFEDRKAIVEIAAIPSVLWADDAS
jgi:hypothetical protein